MAKVAFVARVGSVGFLAFVVVCQHDVGRAIAARLRVFGAVHRCRAQQIGGQSGVDQHIALIVEPVFSRQRPRAMHQRHPSDAAILVKTSHIKRAIAQQPRIGGAVFGNRAFRDIFVLVIKSVVVAHIHDQLAIFADRGFCAFMAEAAQCGVFDRGRGRVHRVHFDHPAEFVRHVGFFVDIVAVVELAPGIPAARYTIAFLLRGIVMRAQIRLAICVQNIGPEIAVKVFLSHQPCAPRGHAARAVVDRADHIHARRIVVCFHALVTRGRA